MKIFLKVLLLTILFAAAHWTPVWSQQEQDIELMPYKEYIQDPQKLGFAPDSSFFRSAYMLIKSKFVDQISDEAILAGCKKEVNRLLKEGGKPQNFNPASLGAVDQSIQQLSGVMNKNLLWYAATEGVFLSTRDPYTLMMTPKEYDVLMEQMQGKSFGGIGVYIEQDKNNGNRLSVFEPIEGTPAYRAGILPEDYISHIDGVATKTLPLDVAAAKMRGEVGSYITLTIVRKGEKSPLTFKLKRENIKIHSISCKLIEKDYGYIKVRTFGDDTGDEFYKALSLLEQKNIKGLILDLRNNGGGMIDASIELCSSFIPTGNNIVSVAGRSTAQRYYRSLPNAYKLKKMPVVVLINKYSASASEITAGALQDYKLATLMGTKSYGKGSVQELMPINRGGAFKITVAHYFTPKNRNIDKKGIEPDIKSDMDVKLVGRPGDTQLKAAVDYLKKQR